VAVTLGVQGALAVELSEGMDLVEATCFGRES